MPLFSPRSSVYLGRTAVGWALKSQAETARESKLPEDWEEVAKTRRTLSLLDVLNRILWFSR
jgi:hypothetical protein